MKHVVFSVLEKKSYIKSLGWPSIKAGTKLPLIVPLEPGGLIDLSFDEKKHVAIGRADKLRFVTDRFKASSTYYLTGKMQKVAVNMSQLDLAFNPKTGSIHNAGGYTFVYGAQQMGGTGSLALWYLGTSGFKDGNSPKFDLSNGLGCAGALTLEMGTGNPTDFIIHIEAVVSHEDSSGNNKFDRFCPVGLRIFWKLDYEPPWLRIQPPFWFDWERVENWPNRGAFSEVIPLEELLSMVGPRRKLEPIEGIELRSPHLGLALVDGRGRIVDGVMSGRRIKRVVIDPERAGDLWVALIPGGSPAAAPVPR